ncbi:MAG: hypothetical protein ABIK84_00660 [candidate division WOR-3 bacterium]
MVEKVLSKKKRITLLGIFLFFSFSLGVTLWETGNIKIDGGNKFSTYPMCRSLATRGPDTLHCVYSDWQAELPTHNVYYSRSTNGGSSWISPTSWPASANSYPSITAWGNYVYISYPNGSVITFRRSTNNGQNWGYNNFTPPSGTPISSAIGCWGNNVYLIAHSYAAPEHYLYFSRSTDNGSNWPVSPTLLGNGQYPSISVWRDTIHLVYYLGSKWGIFYRRSTDGGQTWSDTVRLGTLLSEAFPSIDCRKGLVGVVWSLASTYGTISFRASTNSGTSWQNLSSPGTGKWATVTVGGYLSHIIYCDSTNYGNYELVHRFTPNNGQTWSPTERLTNTPTRSINPYIYCFADTLLRLVWTEKDTVYFKKGKYFPRDIELFSIPSPPRTIDSGSSYTPACSVYNTGLDTARSFWVWAYISSLTGGMIYYNESTLVTNLPPNTKQRLSLNQFTANWPRGSYVLTCSTKYDLDQYDKNNFKRCTLTIRVRDVGILEILAPPDSVNYGDNITPQVRLRNFGTVNANFNAKMTIGSLYKESVDVSLAPNEIRDISFPNWLVLERGTLIAKCSTKLANDLRPENDTLTKRVKVGVGDVGVVQIIGPIGISDSGFSVIPRAKVKNFGTLPFSFPVRFSIGSFYTDVQSVDNLGPNEERDVDFNPVTLSVRGYHTVSCSTELIGDQDNSNDGQRDNLLIRVLDVAFGRRLVPKDSIRADSLFFPKVRLRNLGFPEVSFTCLFVIKKGDNTIYSQRVTVEPIPPLDSADVEFPPLTLPDTGMYLNYINCELSGDQNPENNSFAGIFKVYLGGPGSQPPAWMPMVSVPPEPDMKRVKSGGGMTASPEALYILKGNNTRSLYFYNPASGEIRFLDTIPSGTSGKKVKKGSGITYGDGNLYIAKGAGTKELWCYAIGSGEWSSIEIPGDKGLKGGTGIAYLPGYLYLLKGSKTNEFYRYNFSSSRWEILPNAPTPVVDGSRMTTDGAKIYLLLGKKNYFYTFDPTANQWTSKESLPLFNPLTNKKKKVKDGASLVCFLGKIYCVKGGNTQDFWKYDPDSSLWYPLELVPKGMSNKGVGGGAGLAVFANKIYLLKGNNTLEIWRYDGEGISSPLVAKREEREKSQKKGIPSPSVLERRIYNILGEVIYQGKGKPALKPGIYFLEEGREEKRKIVVVK